MSSNLESPSSFFKVILPGCISNLSIPISFRRYLNIKSGNESAILRRGDHKWQVKIGDDWVFGEGWDKFTRDNGVEECDILVFSNLGNLVFEIAVFDSSSCERDYPNHNQLPESSQKLFKDATVEEPVEEPGKTTIPEQTGHSYFIGTVRQYDNSSKSMLLPKTFALANKLRSGEVILKNAEVKGSWPVKFINRLDTHFSIKCGFEEFCTAIGLKTGDRFRFELTSKGKKPVAMVSRVAVVDPFFKVTATEYHIMRPCVNVPLDFARSYKLDRNCELIVIDDKNREFPARVAKSGGHVYIRNLRDLWEAVGLKEGDEFMLKIVDTGTIPRIKFSR